MNIRSNKKDIVGICMGHECEGCAMLWLGENNKRETPKTEWEAYEDGFEGGIRFLANYLKDYGITIEINDETVQTIQKEDWYSGEVIDKLIDEEKLDEFAYENNIYDTMQEPYWNSFMKGFKSGYKKAKEEN